MELYKSIIEKLISFPQRGNIKIDFDCSSKKFCLSIPIYLSKKGLPKSVERYVDARKNLTFLPHETSFAHEEEKVFLRQKIPFDYGLKGTLRRQVDDFWQLAKHCHRMLSEIGAEEIYQGALDSHFSE